MNFQSAVRLPFRNLVPAVAVALLCVVGAPASTQAQTAKKVPCWVSIAKGEARMRVGPSEDYPANWQYQRRNLPLRVIAVFSNWRKVEDPDGIQGWMNVRLLKDDPTAIVRGARETVMRDEPSASGRVVYRVEAGVVGRVSDCVDGWCLFNVNGQSGYVETRYLWGATDAD